MTDLKPGDPVKCTLGESVIVGTVWRIEDSAGANKRVHVQIDGTEHCNAIVCVADWLWSVEKLEPELPSEPPVGTVLREPARSPGSPDLIWQHVPAGWIYTGCGEILSWERVLDGLGGDTSSLVRLGEQPDNGPLVSLDELLCWLESERLAHPIADWLKAALAERYGGKQP